VDFVRAERPSERTVEDSVALQYGLLGPVRVSHNGGELDLGTPQQCAVLGRFLLAKGLSVPETPRSPADLVVRGRRCGGTIDRWR
jgi:hypothetical protein